MKLKELIGRLGSAVEGVPPGPWTKGRTLLTAQTKGWSNRDWVYNDRVEKHLIFSNFLARDKGESRTHVCTVSERQGDNVIEYIELANPENMKILLEALRDYDAVAAHYAASQNDAVSERAREVREKWGMA